MISVLGHGRKAGPAFITAKRPRARGEAIVLQAAAQVRRRFAFLVSRFALRIYSVRSLKRETSSPFAYP